jgi:hypothetical protein
MRVILDLGFEQWVLRPRLSADAVAYILEGARKVHATKGYGNGMKVILQKGDDELLPPRLVHDDQIVEPPAPETDGPVTEGEAAT